MKSLIIIDFQKDFSNPKGSLYVEGAEKAEQALIDYINKNAKDLIEVVFTVDWHSPNHCSFKKNGGIWPVHCIQFSEGAGISDAVMNACIENGLTIRVFKKANVDECEEYGAFDHVGTYGHSNGELDIVANNINGSQTLIFNSCNFVVAGIAGDYCVKESIKNLLKYNGPIEMNIEILKDAIASIDGGTALDEFINENNLQVITA